MQPVTNHHFIPWLMLIIGLCIALSSYAKQPLEPPVKPSPVVGPVTDMPRLSYSVDQIEESVAILIPRQPGREPIQVAHGKLACAQEGDIIGAISGPSPAYYLDEKETRRVQSEIEDLLTLLQAKSEVQMPTRVKSD